MPTPLQIRAALAAARPLLAILATAILLCWPGCPAQAGSRKLPASLAQCRFIAYTPRGFSVDHGKVTPASRQGIKEDLTILRPFFDGLITYSSADNIETAAAVASELGYRAVIVGIWDPFSVQEINNALAAASAYPDLVVAAVIGNEGIYTKRYSAQDLQPAIARIKKRAPNLAITTSEPFFLYFKPEFAALFQSLDLQMPNVHPVFEPWFKPEEPERGAAMVIDVAKKLAETFPQPLLIKETGTPSAGAPGYSLAIQARFWSELGKRFPVSPVRAFAYFEAFDAPWKPAAMALELPGDHAIESHWGLFTATGRPKEAITILPPLK